MKNGRILVVDDNQANIHIVETILKKDQYEVYTANDGVEGLKVAEEIGPDLILLDVQMPRMDGFETCASLKNIPELKDIPVIFLTANKETRSIIKGFELGAVDYLTKPFKSVEFRARVRTQLELRLSQALIEQKNEEQEDLLDKLKTIIDTTGHGILDLVEEIDSAGDAMSKELILQKMKLTIVEMLVSAGNKQLEDDLERLRAGAMAGDVKAQDQESIDNLLASFGM